VAKVAHLKVEDNINGASDTVMDQLNKRFYPKRDFVVGEYHFRESKQNEGESIHQYSLRLRSLAKYCNFHELDREICSQIVRCCISHDFRKKMLGEPKLTLEILLQKRSCSRYSGERRSYSWTNYLRMTFLKRLKTSQPVGKTVVIPKKDSSEVNKAIKREKLEMPNAEDIIRRANGMKVFSKIDLNSAFEQFLLASNSRHISRFRTHRGIY